MNAQEAGKEHQEDDSATEQKLPRSEAAGRGDSIPRSADGVGIGASTEPNTFEPEEAPDADDDNANS
jgi:hypothetical protein